MLKIKPSNHLVAFVIEFGKYVCLHKFISKQFLTVFTVKYKFLI